MMKLVIHAFIIAVLLLSPGRATGEEYLTRAGNSWLGNVSSDKKSFTPCGGKAETVKSTDKITETDRKCDSDTAYEPPERRYVALLELYNRLKKDDVQAVVAPGTVRATVRDPESLLVVRSAMGAAPAGVKMVPFAVDAIVPVYNLPVLTKRSTSHLRF
jgi:hypothetical protein